MNYFRDLDGRLYPQRLSLYAYWRMTILSYLFAYLRKLAKKLNELNDEEALHVWHESPYYSKRRF